MTALFESLENRRLLAASPIFMESQIQLPADSSTVLPIDVNNDGLLDLVMYGTPSSPQTLSIAMNQGDGRYEISDSHTYPTGFDKVLVSDLDRDGYLDLVVNSIADGQLHFLWSNGNGTFTETFIDTGVGSARLIAMGDFNRDGSDDIAVGGGSDFTIVYVEGTTVYTGETTSYGGGVIPQDLMVADLNGDRMPDVLLKADTGLGMIVQGFVIQHDGTFVAAAVTEQITGPVFIKSADFNGDGFADLVITDGSMLKVARGNGDGSFITKIDWDIYVADGNMPHLVDLDQDGYLDIVVEGNDPTQTPVFFNRGNGDFNTTVQNLGVYAKTLQVLSWGDDGVNLVGHTPGQSGASVTYVWENGYFDSPVNYPTAHWFQNLVVGNVDGRSGPAIVTTDANGLVTVMKWIAYPLDGAPRSVALFHDGQWRLDSGQGQTPGLDPQFEFGQPGDIAVSGKWLGDGVTRAGIFRDGLWILDTNGTPGFQSDDLSFHFGGVGMIPVVGDWMGTGQDEVGVFDKGRWGLDTDGDRGWTPGSDISFEFGNPGMTPVVGDWNGLGRMEVGVFQDGRWALDSDGSREWNPTIDSMFDFGGAGMTPVVGHWNGTPQTDVGVFDNGRWALDSDGVRGWNPLTDALFDFGGVGMKPFIGNFGDTRQDTVGVFHQGALALNTVAVDSTNSQLPWHARSHGGTPFTIGAEDEQILVGWWLG